jgi:hypothetical protein
MARIKNPTYRDGPEVAARFRGAPMSDQLAGVKVSDLIGSGYGPGETPRDQAPAPRRAPPPPQRQAQPPSRSGTPPVAQQPQQRQRGMSDDQLARLYPGWRPPASSAPPLGPHAAAVQAAGRKGDKILAHINPHEAAMLKAAGGSGSRNPRTGLLEFSDVGADGDGSGGAGGQDHDSEQAAEHGTEQDARDQGGSSGGGGGRSQSAIDHMASAYDTASQGRNGTGLGADIDKALGLDIRTNTNGNTSYGMDISPVEIAMGLLGGVPGQVAGKAMSAAGFRDPLEFNVHTGFLGEDNRQPGAGFTNGGPTGGRGSSGSNGPGPAGEGGQGNPGGGMIRGFSPEQLAQLYPGWTPPTGKGLSDGPDPNAGPFTPGDRMAARGQGGDSLAATMSPEQAMALARLADAKNPYGAGINPDTGHVQLSDTPPGFDAAGYLAANPDVAKNPAFNTPEGALAHYQQFGYQEDRAPGGNVAGFNSSYYLANNPDVAANSTFGNSPQGALIHYEQYGQGEGRKAYNPGVDDTVPGGTGNTGDSNDDIMARLNDLLGKYSSATSQYNPDGTFRGGSPDGWSPSGNTAIGWNNPSGPASTGQIDMNGNPVGGGGNSNGGLSSISVNSLSPDRDPRFRQRRSGATPGWNFVA